MQGRLSPTFSHAGEAALTRIPGLSVPASVLPAGYRNEFHAGLQQAFGKYLVVDGEYLWKYTHNAYDFSILGQRRRSLSRSLGTIRRFPVYDPRERAELPRFHGARGDVRRRRAVLHSTDWRCRRGAVTPGSSARCSVSTTTKNLTRQPTCNTSLEARAVGWVQLAIRQRSGGWRSALRGRQLRTTDRQAAIRWSTRRILTPDQQFQAGLFCGAVHATTHDAHQSQFRLSCVAVRVHIPADPGSGNRK